MQITAILSVLSLAAVAVAGPVAEPGTSVSTSPLEKRGCTSNTGTHCNMSRMPGQDVGSRHGDIDDAIADLMSYCNNGNFPHNAKRVASKQVNGVIAYACNSFCRQDYLPCQDAGWSLARVRNTCNWQRMGWDSQESRGSWYGISYSDENPCGWGYSQGVTYR